MKLKDFIEKKLVKKISPDHALAKSLQKTAEKDLTFLKNTPINQDSARKITSNYYDVLRSLIEALTTLDGYKMYSHEAYTHYLKEKGEEHLAEKYDRYRKIRNKINYYGEDINTEEAKEYTKEITQLIEILKKKLQKTTQEH